MRGELKHRFYEEMRITAWILEIALKRNDPELLARAENRLFDEAHLLMRAGYRRLAERIAFLVASGALRKLGEEPPPPYAAMAMEVPLLHELDDAVGGSGETPPSSVAVALVVPGRYGVHSIVLRGRARSSPDVA